MAKKGKTGRRSTTWLTERYLYVFKDCFAVDRVERQQGPVKFDCFGFADLVGIGNRRINDQYGLRTYWIQTTSISHLKARLDKVSQNKTALLLASNEHDVLVTGWEYKGEGIYELRENRLVVDSFSDLAVYQTQIKYLGLEDLVN